MPYLIDCFSPTEMLHMVSVANHHQHLSTDQKRFLIGLRMAEVAPDGSYKVHPDKITRFNRIFGQFLNELKPGERCEKAACPTCDRLQALLADFHGAQQSDEFRRFMDWFQKSTLIYNPAESEQAPGRPAGPAAPAPAVATRPAAPLDAGDGLASRGGPDGADGNEDTPIAFSRLDPAATVPIADSLPRARPASARAVFRSEAAAAPDARPATAPTLAGAVPAAVAAATAGAPATTGAAPAITAAAAPKAPTPVEAAPAAVPAAVPAAARSAQTPAQAADPVPAPASAARSAPGTLPDPAPGPLSAPEPALFRLNAGHPGVKRLESLLAVDPAKLDEAGLRNLHGQLSSEIRGFLGALGHRPDQQA